MLLCFKLHLPLLRIPLIFVTFPFFLLNSFRPFLSFTLFSSIFFLFSLYHLHFLYYYHFPFFSVHFSFIHFLIILFIPFYSIFVFIFILLSLFSLHFLLLFQFLCSIPCNHVYVLIYRWTDDSQVYINHVLNPSSVFIPPPFSFLWPFLYLKLPFPFFLSLSLTHLD